MIRSSKPQSDLPARNRMSVSCRATVNNERQMAAGEMLCDAEEGRTDGQREQQGVATIAQRRVGPPTSAISSSLPRSKYPVQTRRNRAEHNSLIARSKIGLATLRSSHRSVKSQNAGYLLAIISFSKLNENVIVPITVLCVHAILPKASGTRTSGYRPSISGDSISIPFCLYGIKHNFGSTHP